MALGELLRSARDIVRGGVAQDVVKSFRLGDVLAWFAENYRQFRFPVGLVVLLGKLRNDGLCWVWIGQGGLGLPAIWSDLVTLEFGPVILA